MTDITPLGTILKGRYQIIELIKRGGMGAVFKARDINSGRIMALKELLDPDPNPVERENNLKMFQEEARILATLSHPNIPRVTAYFHDNNRHYLVMDFIDGENLEEKLNKALQQNKMMPQNQVLSWGMQVCKVFDYLHNYRPTPIIFRDLKPANIMVTRQEEVKLIDFGIARTYKVGKSKDTFIFGTINYASPEHRGSTQTDHRSDIYTLGATLYHLLTGFPPVPFYTPPAGNLIKKNPCISFQVENVIIKAMAQDKKDRYQSAREMLQALERASRSKPAGIPVPSPPSHSQVKPQKVYSPPPPQVAQPPTVLVETPVIKIKKKLKYCGRCGHANRVKAKYCSKCRYIIVKGSGENNVSSVPKKVKVSPDAYRPAASGGASGQFFAQGMKFFKEGAFTKAGREFQKAIQFDTRNSRASFMSGRVYFEVKDYSQALNFFHRSLELEPDNAEVVVYIGRASLELKDYNRAKNTFLHAIKLNPNLEEAYRWLGKTYFYKKEYKKAIEELEKVLRLNPGNLLVYLDLFHIYRAMTYYHKALQCCKKALVFDDSNPELYFCLGLAHCDIAEFKEALRYFKKALRLNPSHWRSHYHMGLVHRYRGREADSITELKKALTLSPDSAEIYREIATSYRQLGSIAKAKKALQEAMRLDPHNPQNKQLMDSLRRS